MKKKRSNNVIVLAERARELRRKKGAPPAPTDLAAETAAELGIRLLRGEGVQRDLGKALALLRKGAEHGIAAAKHELAVCHLKADGVEYDPARALALLQSSSGDGHTESSILLAELYIFGKHCPKNANQAVKLLHAILAQDEPADVTNHG